MDSVSERELKSLILQLKIADWKNPKVATTLATQGVSLIKPMDLEVTSLSTLIISLFKTVDFDSQSKPLTELISLISQTISVVNSTNLESELMPLLGEIWKVEPETEVRSLIKQIVNDVVYTNIESELIHRISRLIFCGWEYPEFMSLFKKIISLLELIDLESNPKPESELMSLITQTISLYNSISMDLESQPKPMIDLLSYIVSQLRSKSPWFTNGFGSYVEEVSHLEPEPELMSLIYKIISLVESKTLKRENLSVVSLVQVTLKKGRLCVDEEYPDNTNNKWNCLLPGWWEKIYLTDEDEDTTYFRCRYCNGENHKEYNKVPVQFKHSLHQKHSLQLVYDNLMTRKCYCCDENLLRLFYCCLVCDFAMNMACLERSPLLSIHYPKWHEHTLALFPRKSSLTCDLCALSDSSCPFYICPPCDFVAHQSCITLPSVIKISRHPHRISFTHTFEQGDWSCGICRRKINNDYGGYSCIKDGCLFAAHSKCATQRNVWDGIDLEGVPEEIEEILEPFVRISDGVIEHFSHPEHHLKIDKNTNRDYDDYKQCQACTMPIYFGNLYSCMSTKCDFILHEECANLSRKIHHLIHPHVLSLVTNYNGERIFCSACSMWCTSFFYLCSEEGCDFRLHVQCAALSEPLVHGSHSHSLYLTSKPEETRSCFVCKWSQKETWNCIECDYSLCFDCAVVPQKVRYKHDKHMFNLCYGNETKAMTSWCEICEREIDPTERFYMCDENCCVTLHIECLIGRELYMKPGWSCLFEGIRILVVPNNRQSRPICNYCRERCSQKVAFHDSRMIFCSIICVDMFIRRQNLGKLHKF